MNIWRILPNRKRDTHKVPPHLECNLLWVYLVSFTVPSTDIIFARNKMAALKTIPKSPDDLMKL